MSWALVGILGWLLLQLGIGVWASRKIKTEDDYLVAGRSLGYPMATATIFATWFGAETCIGAAGQAASEGLNGTVSDPFGYALCLLLMGAFLARPLWRRKLQTLGDLYRDRYGPRAEKAAVLLMVPTSILWASAQVRAFGQVLAAASTLEVHVAIAIAALVVIAYTMVGGMMADAYTDFVQGGVLLVGLLLLGVVVWTSDAAANVHIPVESLRFTHEAGWLATAESWAVPVIGSLIAAELVVRVSASRSPEVAQRSTLLAGVVYLGIGLIPVSIGLAAPQLLGTVEDPEQVLILTAQTFLPTAIAVVFAGALVSAILSTVDSALLVAGSLIGHNVIAPMLGTPTMQTRLRWDRGAVAVCGLVAWFLAESSESVFGLVELASGFGSSGLFVLAVVALTPWRRGGPITALATMACGLGVYIGGEFFALYEGPFVLSLLVSALVFAAGAAMEPAQPAAAAAIGSAS